MLCVKGLALFRLMVIVIVAATSAIYSPSHQNVRCVKLARRPDGFGLSVHRIQGSSISSSFRALGTQYRGTPMVRNDHMWFYHRDEEVVCRARSIHHRLVFVDSMDVGSPSATAFLGLVRDGVRSGIAFEVNRDWEVAFWPVKAPLAQAARLSRAVPSPRDPQHRESDIRVCAEYQIA